MPDRPAPPRCSRAACPGTGDAFAAAFIRVIVIPCFRVFLAGIRVVRLLFAVLLLAEVLLYDSPPLRGAQRRSVLGTGRA
jgi:hypothetical protein